ncbi:MAG: hypothetical protein ACOVP1_09130 [Bacteroidia bacterium]
MNDNHSHKEHLLTVDFLNWFKKHTGYLELFEDSKTIGGDPFDSAGYIKNELILIEFKDKISSSIVSYENSKGSSIEKKIGQVLKQIYHKEHGRIYQAIQTHYTENQIPTIYIVVNSISRNALVSLIKLIEKRQLDWSFNAKIIQWKNGTGLTIYENSDVQCKHMKDDKIEFPLFKNTSPTRKKKLTDTIIIEQLSKIEKLSTYEIFINYCREKGLEIKKNTRSINIKKNRSLFAIWPYDSDSVSGLRISFNMEQINLHINPNLSSFDDLGLYRNKSKIGYLGYNALIKDETAMKQFIKKLEKTS